MAESGEDWVANPSYQGFDYSKARAQYDNSAIGRGYSMASHFKTPKSDKNNFNPGAEVPAVNFEIVPDKIKTNCKSPLVICCDGTGSMGEFPNTIFKKLPLLDDGIKDYLVDCEVSMAMIGDYGDNLPLQVQPFGKDKELINILNNLKIEGGGGGNQIEAYELFALYALHNIEIPKATKPVLIFIGDEGLYQTITKANAKKYAKVDIEKAMTVSAIFEQLKQKFSIYVIRKHYDAAGTPFRGDELLGVNKQMHEQWQQMVGPERVTILTEPGRIADLLLGVLATESNKMEFFTKEISERQTKQQVATVMQSMASIRKDSIDLTTVKDPTLSISKNKKGPEKKTESLL